jgi:type VI secretion system protein ImpE
MTGLALYREGRLREAIQALGDELRNDPLDAKRRTFLFELLLFAGEYDRAEKQLNLLAGASKDAAAGTLLYHSALHAERMRQSMFSNHEFPTVPKPPCRGGLWKGSPFSQFSDADPRIGNNLEVYLAGSYTWIPLQFVRRLEVMPPANLRDLVWARALVETSEEFRLQDIGEVLLPALSPLSSRHADETVQLGRECAWEPDEEYGELPYGPKTLVIDGIDVPVLQLGVVEWPATEKES